MPTFVAQEECRLDLAKDRHLFAAEMSHRDHRGLAAQNGQALYELDAPASGFFVRDRKRTGMFCATGKGQAFFATEDQELTEVAERGLGIRNGA